MTFTHSGSVGRLFAGESAFLPRHTVAYCTFPFLSGTADTGPISASGPSVEIGTQNFVMSIRPSIDSMTDVESLVARKVITKMGNLLPIMYAAKTEMLLMLLMVLMVLISLAQLNYILLTKYTATPHVSTLISYRLFYL